MVLALKVDMKVEFFEVLIFSEALAVLRIMKIIHLCECLSAKI